MKKIILMVSMLTWLTCFTHAQNKDYKVVFDLTSKDTLNQQSLLREMSLIKETNPDAKIEAVIYGQGLGLVTKDGIFPIGRNRTIIVHERCIIQSMRFGNEKK